MASPKTIRPAALVTGGGRRIGEAIVRHLVGRGFDVVLHYNTSAERVSHIIEDIEATHKAPVVIRAVQADVMDRSSIASLMERASDALGPGRAFSLLVNNASIFEPDSIRDATFSSWDRSMRTNLELPFFLTQAFARQYLAAATAMGTASEQELESALVINMVDQRVLKPTPQFASYTLAKLGLHNLTLLSAQEFAPHIRVNSIGPGPTLQGDRQTADGFAAQCTAMPLRRGGSVSEILATVDYFIASKSVTGQLICVDGGQHVEWRTPDTIFKE